MEGTNQQDAADKCPSKRAQHTGRLPGGTELESSRHTEEANIIETKRVRGEWQ